MAETTLTTQQAIWKSKNQRILVLTNSLFYKLGHISNSTCRSGVRASPTHTLTKVLQTHLLEQAGIPKDIARKTLNWSRSLQKKAYAKGNRSHRAKNQRAPPQRQKKHRDPSACTTDDSSDGDGRAESSLWPRSQRSGWHDNDSSLEDLESTNESAREDSEYNDNDDSMSI
jgi:hypothetical protein